ncbi:MAG: SHOCT domain-containing protein [Parabacteroides sp.]|nr:SHOCT domain-containing protein [Parabacteroides sp.]
MDLEKLEKLNRLRQEGALTEAEFEREKQKVIGESAGCPTKEMIMGLSPYEYAAVINFAWFFPYIGWIGSLIFWLLGRNKSDVVDT